MACNENCKCHKGVIALVFVPGMMGSRLKNTESGEIVWDPAPGLELSSDELLKEEKEQREKELHTAKAADGDNTTTKITKWFKNRIVKIEGNAQKTKKMSESISSVREKLDKFFSIEETEKTEKKEETKKTESEKLGTWDKIEREIKHIEKQIKNEFDHAEEKVKREIDHAKSKVKRELQIDYLVNKAEKFTASIGKRVGYVDKAVKTANSAVEKAMDYHRDAHRYSVLISSVSRFLFAGSLKRKQLLVSGKKTKPCFDLDRDLLTVDSGDDKYFKLATSVIPSLVKEKRAKGWGEITWSNYGGFLHFLEKQGRELSQTYPGFKFPVFAIGYNWMLSNEDAGERIKQRLQEFKQYIMENDGRDLEEKNIKFIFVTHSMGGIASRAGFLLHGIESEVIGVIHGAMPTNGSADTYVRMRKGQPGMGKVVIGKNASDMAATLGFSEGGLELLPNQFYTTTGDKKTEWLFYKNKDSNEGRISLINTHSDEVCEQSIYRFYSNTDVWYRLINPRLLAPEIKNEADFSVHEMEYRDSLIARLKGCYYFHQNLKNEEDKQEKNNSHKATVLAYVKTHNISLLKPIKAIKGKKERKRTYSRVVWVGKGQPEGCVDKWKIVANEDKALLFGGGAVHLVSTNDAPCSDETIKKCMVLGSKRYEFKIDKARDEGDGTVHLGANENIENLLVKKELIKSKLDHMKTFEDSDVRKLVRRYVNEWTKEIYNKM